MSLPGSLGLPYLGNLGKGEKVGIHVRVSRCLWWVLELGQSPSGCCRAGESGESGWAAPLGPLPWAKRAGLASSSLALGKTFLPGWPGIQTQTKGGFLSRLFVLLPQRLLCAQQKLIRLCSWEALSCWWPVGMAESLAFSLPWRLHPLPLGLWFPRL